MYSTRTRGFSFRARTELRAEQFDVRAYFVVNELLAVIPIALIDFSAAYDALRLELFFCLEEDEL